MSDTDELKTRLEKLILKSLKKGEYTSKTDFIYSLVNQGFPYQLRYNSLNNKIFPEIESFGGVMKKLRFDKKVKFAVEHGDHHYFKNNRKKIKNVKFSKDLTPKCKWKKFPERELKVSVILKIPGENVDLHHFLFSCLPRANFETFTLSVNKKGLKNNEFYINSQVIQGKIEDGCLILSGYVDPENFMAYYYYLIQIGRKIVIEILHHDYQSSNLLIMNKGLEFIPVYSVFTAENLKLVYDNKDRNILRSFYDYPQKIEGHLYFGKQNLIHHLKDSEIVNYKDYLKYANESFAVQAKQLMHTAIRNDMIIVPQKILHYIPEEDDINRQIELYLQNIDVNKLIDEKLEEKLEKQDFIRDLISNLLLTTLGLSFIFDEQPWMNYVVLGLLAVVNVWFFLVGNRKKKKRKAESK